MLVLDTNVLSEVMRAEPAKAVVEWLGSQPAQNLYTTSITKAEIFHGLNLLPEGRRRRALLAAAEATFAEDFRERLLSFDGHAASEYADIAAVRRRRGRPISGFDAQIAAICRSVGATLATRNTADFEGCGIDLLDPWTEPQ